MQRWLIVGAGDVARRMVPLLHNKVRLFALCRDEAAAAHWRSLGTLPIMGDLDCPATLRRLSGLAQGVFHFAPPPATGLNDSRTRHLIAALRRGMSLPQHLIYISTTGVYGPCAGARLDETRPVNPATARAIRRVNAEQLLRDFGSRSGCTVTILRAPGIYAEDRLPLERLRAGLPIPAVPHDPFTNHIHALDLARAAVRAMHYGRPNRVYNVVDDSTLTLGQYYDELARQHGLPPPPRLPIDRLKEVVGEMGYSFMSESRRVGNHRIKRELALEWQYPCVTSKS
jgi:nucleoside-diphosphate-sugar epimerase